MCFFEQPGDFWYIREELMIYKKIEIKVDGYKESPNDILLPDTALQSVLPLCQKSLYNHHPDRLQLPDAFC